MSKAISQRTRPTPEQLRFELERVTGKKHGKKALRGVVYTFFAVAAVVMIAASFVMPVLKVYGDSMIPNISDGDVVICIKMGEISQGDVIAFYHDSKVLIRRVIAVGGDKVNIDKSGKVYVNDVALDEAYIGQYDMGICDIDLPYTVPAGKYFVMGDNRAGAVDSRCEQVGAVSRDDIVGRLLLRIWPFDKIQTF